METSHFFIGLDLGQAQDFTAIAVLERAVLQGEWDPVLWCYEEFSALRVRHLDRLPLGTSYPSIVENALALARSPVLAGRCSLAVDATGVGRPVIDLLRAAVAASRLALPILPVTITGGAVESSSGGEHRVPKRDLITGVQVLLQSHSLQLAAGLQYAPVLLSEMAEMRIRFTGSGRTCYGADRSAAHDDLVLALALACWAARHRFPAGPTVGPCAEGRIV